MTPCPGAALCEFLKPDKAEGAVADEYQGAGRLRLFGAPPRAITARPVEGRFLLSRTPIVPVLLAGGSGTRLWPVSRDTTGSHLGEDDIIRLDDVYGRG